MPIPDFEDAYTTAGALSGYITNTHSGTYPTAQGLSATGGHGQWHDTREFSPPPNNFVSYPLAVYKQFNVPDPLDCFYIAVQMDVYKITRTPSSGIPDSTIGLEVFIGGDSTNGGIALAAQYSTGRFFRIGRSYDGDTFTAAGPVFGLVKTATVNDGDTILLEIEAIASDPSMLWEVRYSVNGTVELTEYFDEGLGDWSAYSPVKTWTPTPGGIIYAGIRPDNPSEWDNLKIWAFEK